MKRTCWAFLILLGLMTGVATACSVPVFRYALERWPADYYGAMVIHKGPLSEVENELLEEFKAGVEQGDAYLNLEILTRDLSDPEPGGKLDKLLGGLVPEKLPAVALWYPWRMRREPPALVWDFNRETVDLLLRSPARQEVAKRILDGDSAVWLFLESENAKTNESTLARLKTELRGVEAELEEIRAESVDPQTEGLAYKFSVLSISHDDPKEKALIEMLMNSEEGLDEYEDMPMVFPMYGQGRALFAMVGDGINSNNILDVVGFLTGPCSCQVKSMNPGTDIMMAANWEKAVMDKDYVSDEDLPPLSANLVEPDPQGETGIAETVESETQVEKDLDDAATVVKEDGVEKTLATPLLIVLIGLIVVVAVGTVMLRARS